jgi:CheY-like chemotaxis protein
VLHELATNARKYGALSLPAGRLAITWMSEQVGGENELRLEWRETGTRAGHEPVTRGFGTLLIERSLLSNGGTTVIRYLPGGFACTIRLPLGTAPTARARLLLDPTGNARQERGAPSPLAGLRILVVEDEPLIAMDIEEQLLGAGGDVIGPATNLETARRLIADTSPDVALLDANLAGRRVDDLAFELRRRGIPFAFATGFGRASLPEAFRYAPVLAKPFGSEEIVETVRELLASRDATDQVIPIPSRP